MRRSAGEGFSFAELLVATAILAAALVPLFVMQTNAFERARSSQPMLFATALANEVAEQVRLLPFSSLPTSDLFRFKTGPGVAGPVFLPGPAPVPLAIGTYPFETEVTIEIEPLKPPQLLARLTLTIAFAEGASRTKKEHRHVELIENRMLVGHE